MIAIVVTGVYLLILAVEDMASKSVGVAELILGVGPIAVSLLTENEPGGVVRILGLIPGIVILIISLITKGKIGIADAVVLCILGLTVGIYESCAVLAVACMLLIAYSVALLAGGRLKRNSRVAFLPFLFIGFVMMHCIEG